MTEDDAYVTSSLIVSDLIQSDLWQGSGRCGPFYKILRIHNSNLVQMHFALVVIPFIKSQFRKYHDSVVAVARAKLLTDMVIFSCEGYK